MKSNIFVYGPTGCGKTEIVRTIGKMFDIPVIGTQAHSWIQKFDTEIELTENITINAIAFPIFISNFL